MEIKKKENYISKKELQETLSNIGKIRYPLISFAIALFFFPWMLSSFLYFLPDYPTLVIRLIILSIMASIFLYKILHVIVIFLKESEHCFILYLEDKDIKECKKIEYILNKTRKIKNYFKKKKLFIIANNILFIIIILFSLVLFLRYLFFNPLDELSHFLTFLIGSILLIFVLIGFGILSTHIINIKMFKIFIIISFISLLDDIDIKFEKFLKYQEIEYQNLKILLEDLDAWYKVYLSVFFNNNDSNNLMFEYRSKYFPTKFKKYYYTLFLDLKSKILDLKYRKERDNDKNNLFNDKITKLKKILENYIERLEFDIREKREAKRRIREWWGIICPIVIIIIIFIFQIFL